MRLAFVVQRYGLEVNGGAELLCRMIAEKLAKHHDVEVLTTCATDYMSWKNEYTAGENTIHGVKVRRFHVNKERDIKEFNRFSEKVLNKKHTIAEEEEWMEKQGPYCQKLIKYLKDNKDDYDIIFFVTYLYYTTYHGIQIAPDKSILISTAHDEPPIYLKIFEQVFNTPKAIVYLTDAEKRFVNGKFKNTNITSIVAAMGVEAPEKTDPEDFRKKYGIKDEYIVYTGRVDESKGCKELIDYFIRYKKETGVGLKLVLVGKEVMKFPKNPDIIMTGFISDQDKNNAIAASKLMVMPSPYESLSIAILEAWLQKKPVIVNGKSEVLKEQVTRSNGGLYYTNYDEFKYTLNLILKDKKTATKLGKNGKQYVEKNYNWQTIGEKYEKLLKEIKDD